MSQEIHLIVRRAKKHKSGKKELKNGQICELNVRDKRLTVEQIKR